MLHWIVQDVSLNNISVRMVRAEASDCNAQLQNFEVLQTTVFVFRDYVVGFLLDGSRATDNNDPIPYAL